MGSYNKRISDQSKIKFDPINRELIDSENSELDARVESLEENITGSKTATGNPITIEDVAPVNAVNLSMDLEPIQDLHGYDHPWVGGAGKNKLPMTVEEIKAANTSGTWSGNVYTVSGGTFTIQTDNDSNVTGVLVNGTFTETVILMLVNDNDLTTDFAKAILGNTITLNGCPKRTGNPYVQMFNTWGTTSSIYDNGTDPATLAVPSTISGYRCDIVVYEGTVSNVLFKPMIRLSSETDSSFAPYTNICPISGRSQVIVTIKDNPSEPTVTKNYTIQLGQTVYGGHLDVTKGKMVVDSGYIASYNGETLPSTWISDRDVYASGTTPTIGAEVVYELAEPFTIDLTPQQIKLLENTNTITTDYDGDVLSLEYQPNNAFGELLGEVNNIYDSIIEDIYDKIDSLDTRVTALEE